ncbi:MAG: hypothetical protein U5L96_11190 [Owenweeksia sp.]|nr:hypothetical protein [Owenweeksia sp.]
MVRIVDYLHKANLVQRKENPDDRREHLLKATHKGRNSIPTIRQAMLATNELSLEGFNGLKK